MENITAVMVTRGDNFKLIRRSYECFARQTHQDKNLLIATNILSKEIDSLSRKDNRVMALHASFFKQRTLGWMRNTALEFADRLSIQWDDDDIYSPKRMEIQYKALRNQIGKYGVVLNEQLHYFDDSNEVGWVVIPNGIEGTILFDQTCNLTYPDLPKGEDTPLKQELQERNWLKVIPCGTVYCRTFHGGNVWDRSHHIKRVHRFGKTKTQLKGVYHLLEKAAKEYNFKPGWKVIYGEN